MGLTEARPKVGEVPRVNAEWIDPLGISPEVRLTARCLTELNA